MTGRALGLFCAAVALSRGENKVPEADTFEYDLDPLTPEQMRSMHGKMDTNADGKVSMAEIMGFSDRMRKQIAAKDISDVLSEMDADKDGKLSWTELVSDMEQWGDDEDKKEREQRVEEERAKFRAADANGDELLDLVEMTSLFYPETHPGVLEITARTALKQKDVNGDGKLTAKEFWEGDVVESEDIAISEEEEADFRKLDLDKDGFLSVDELRHWESGRFHTEEAMKRLFELADKDNDMHLTADELNSALPQIAGIDAQYHLTEWAEHSYEHAEL